MALEWGNYQNGRIPRSALKPVRVASGHLLRADAESGLTHLVGVVKNQGLQGPYLTDSYRDYDTQVRIRASKGKVVATAKPGTSRHGWALAIDARPVLYNWMLRQEAVVRSFGWVNPAWAKQRGKNHEPWHWEWVGRKGQIPPGPLPRGPEEKMQIERGDKGAHVAHVQRLVNGALSRSGWTDPLLGVDGEWGQRSIDLWDHARQRAQASLRLDFPEEPLEPSDAQIAMLTIYVAKLGGTL